MSRVPVSALAVLLVTVLQGLAAAQGLDGFLNVEAPQVKPIALADVGGRDWLLVCNTPDNSVEVYDPCDESWGPEHRPVLRIPTGQRPVSVETAVIAGQTRVFTANYLGDSVTIATLSPSAGPAPIEYRIERTVEVGDAPMDLFAVDHPVFGQHLFVSKRSNSSISWLDPLTGQPTAPGNDDMVMTTDDLFGSDETPTGAMAVKEPHTILPVGELPILVVLGHQGGGAPESRSNDPIDGGGGIPPFDLDVWFKDFQTGNVGTVAGLGTTNFNMAFDGDLRLWVVGTEALNDREGNDDLKDEPTGFVKTMLYRHDFVSGVTTRRDLNAGVTSPADSLAHATDVAIYEPAEGPEQLVCVTAFNSDNFAMIDATSFDPAVWSIQRVPVTAWGGNPVAGPRGLVVKPARDGVCDPGERIYVMNRLDNSVSVIDPDGGVPVELGGFALANDPVPEYVRRGQQFLYSTDFSGSGFVSCASCHVDARSDQLRWKLSSDPAPIPFPLSEMELSGTLQSAIDNLLATGFPSAGPTGKGALVTQSLQGLLNFEAGGDTEAVSNAPFHWRGDKNGFTDFNEAFVNLQDMAAEPGAAPGGGITQERMEQYEDYIHSVHYPPNALQPRNREFSGNLGDPNRVSNGSGGKRGLKLFHILETPELGGAGGNLFAGRSCVQCHALPEGSNNRITELGAGGFSSGSQPLETAALRGMRQKEARLTFSPDVVEPEPTNLRTGDWGMGRRGREGLSLNGFKAFLALPGSGFNGNLTALNEFTREFDHGTAPMIGRTVQYELGDSLATAEADLLEIEAQVGEANCGLAVYLRDADGGTETERGFWYRLSGGATYEEVPPGTGQLSRSQLLALVDEAGDLLIATATPLGEARRVASLDGVAEPATGTPTLPTSLAFVGTTPNTAYRDVPLLRSNWDPDLPVPKVTMVGVTPPRPFQWTGSTTGVGGGPAPIPLSLRTQLIFQDGLIAQGLMPFRRHEAPRRLQLTGFDLKEGARIRLEIPDSSGPSDQIELPLYPTSKTAGSLRIWETAVEFNAINLYSLLFGGAGAPGVAEALNGDAAAVGLFQPVGSLPLRVAVRNEDTDWSDGIPTPLVY